MLRSLCSRCVETDDLALNASRRLLHEWYNLWFCTVSDGQGSITQLGPACMQWLKNVLFGGWHWSHHVTYGIHFPLWGWGGLLSCLLMSLNPFVLCYLDHERSLMQARVELAHRSLLTHVLGRQLNNDFPFSSGLSFFLGVFPVQRMYTRCWLCFLQCLWFARNMQ